MLAPGALACASDDAVDAGVQNPSVTEEAPAGESGNGGSAIDEPASSPLPSVQVRNVVSGEAVDLSTLLPGTKPLVVWFWAPY
jgi:hypothetical protein